jgi:hypothetical protein
MVESKDIVKEQRDWFIDYWVKFMKTHRDQEWSKQQCFGKFCLADNSIIKRRRIF